MNIIVCSTCGSKDVVYGVLDVIETPSDTNIRTFKPDGVCRYGCKDHKPEGKTTFLDGTVKLHP